MSSRSPVLLSHQLTGHFVHRLGLGGVEGGGDMEGQGRGAHERWGTEQGAVQSHSQAIAYYRPSQFQMMNSSKSSQRAFLGASKGSPSRLSAVHWLLPSKYLLSGITVR